MKTAYIFPGQGAQFTGMGRQLYEQSNIAKDLFETANDLLGFRISDIMFNGSAEELKETKVTQPAIFIHSVIAFKTAQHAQPHMVAGHSLGEFSALVANEVLTFEEALKLVSIRALAMQKACEITPSTMAAVLALPDDVVIEICNDIQEKTGEIVMPANYNCPGQVVISGSVAGVEAACEAMKAAGAKRALVLPVSGAFHSPFMQPAREELAAAIMTTTFKETNIPVYENLVAAPVTAPSAIQQNLIGQLTGAVKWTQCVEAMIADGATQFIECGPGKVLQGLVSKINKEVAVQSIS